MTPNNVINKLKVQWYSNRKSKRKLIYFDGVSYLVYRDCFVRYTIQPNMYTKEWVAVRFNQPSEYYINVLRNNVYRILDPLAWRGNVLKFIWLTKIWLRG